MSELIIFYSSRNYQKTYGFFYDFKGNKIQFIAQIFLILDTKFGNDA